MEQQQINQPIVQPVADRSGRAVAALVLGIIGLLAWLIPFIGLPIQIVGLVLGIQSRKSTKHGMAIAGIVLSSIGILLSIVSALLGMLIFASLGVYTTESPLPY